MPDPLAPSLSGNSKDDARFLYNAETLNPLIAACSVSANLPLPAHRAWAFPARWRLAFPAADLARATNAANDRALEKRLGQRPAGRRYGPSLPALLSSVLRPPPISATLSKPSSAFRRHAASAATEFGSEPDSPRRRRGRGPGGRLQGAEMRAQAGGGDAQRVRTLGFGFAAGLGKGPRWRPMRG
jgi:hypothetical protein